MWPIVIAYFIAVMALGFIAGRRVKDSTEYYLGGKQFGPVLTAFKFASTAESGACMVGTPGMAYSVGLPGMLQEMFMPIAYFMSFRVYGQRLKAACDHFRTITVPQLLEKRYRSRTVRVLGAIAILIGLGGNLTAQLKAMGEVFSLVLNIPYVPAVLLGIAVVGIYCVVGGYTATVWTDTLQGAIMLIGAVLLVVFTSTAVFGANGFSFAKLNAALNEVNPDLLTLTGGGAMPGMMIITIFLIILCLGMALPQQAVALFSMRDRRVARWSLVICSIFSVILLWGLVPSAMMGHMLLPPLDNPDQLIPTLMAEVMPPWCAGIFLAAILAAIMSTVSGVIVVAASALSQDVISIAAPEAYHKRPVFWDRMAVALMVIIPVLIALKPPAIVFWLILFSFGMVVVSFLMPMLGTIFWKGGNKYGAISGMLVGLILVPFWMVIGEPGIPALLLGMIASPLVFIIVSLATKDKQDLGDVVDPLWEVYSEI